jgi:hypothetical protein
VDPGETEHTQADPLLSGLDERHLPLSASRQSFAMITVNPSLHEVEQAIALQRRLYWTITETMRAMARRICEAADWEATKLMTRHIWIDAEHADAIRSRFLELRFPRVDIDMDVDAPLIHVLEKLPSTDSDEEFLAGVYMVIKPEVLDAVERSCRQSHPLDDAPSHRALGIIVEEILTEMAAFDEWWNERTAASRAAAEPWCNWLRNAIDNAGGISCGALAPNCSAKRNAQSPYSAASRRIARPLIANLA